MKSQVTTLAMMHSQKILLAGMVMTFLLVGAAGEAVAHNPAGQPVPGCENGADTVAHKNPNCHAGE